VPGTGFGLQPGGGALVASLVARTVRDFVLWIVHNTGTESAWTFKGSSGGTAGGNTPFKLVGATSAGGEFTLQRTTGSLVEQVTLDYGWVGVGLGIAPPWQVWTLSGSLPEFPSDGSLRIRKGERDFNSVADFMGGDGIRGPCAAIVLDGTFLAGGWSGGIMLLGVSDGFIRVLHDMQRHARELRDAVMHKAPSGFWNQARDAAERPLTIQKDAGLLALDQARLMMRLQTGDMFKAALFFQGAEVSATVASASITAFVGGVHAAK